MKWKIDGNGSMPQYDLACTVAYQAGTAYACEQESVVSGASSFETLKANLIVSCGLKLK
jgi:hypothetical protein